MIRRVVFVNTGEGGDVQLQSREYRPAERQVLQLQLRDDLVGSAVVRLDSTEFVLRRQSTVIMYTNADHTDDGSTAVFDALSGSLRAYLLAYGY